MVVVRSPPHDETLAYQFTDSLKCFPHLLLYSELPATIGPYEAEGLLHQVSSDTRNSVSGFEEYNEIIDRVAEEHEHSAPSESNIPFEGDHTNRRSDDKRSEEDVRGLLSAWHRVCQTI